MYARASTKLCPPSDHRVEDIIYKEEQQATSTSLQPYATQNFMLKEAKPATTADIALVLQGKTTAQTTLSEQPEQEAYD